MVGKKEVVLKPMTLAEMDKFKVLKTKVIEGKDLEAKNSGVATEATKTKPDQRTVPQIPADLSKDCTDFSPKDLLKPLCPMHDYCTDFVKGTSCPVSNIGDAELKIHASEQGKLEVMQQGFKETAIVDNVEIEQVLCNKYEAEAKYMKDKVTYFEVDVAYQSKILLTTAPHQLFKILILSYLKNLMIQLDW
nr:hypothetical protein CFP56_16084 [Quercus suber]